MGDIIIGEGIVLIAGPCAIESEDICLETAGELKSMTQEIGIPFIFKSSYDKANRTSINSFRGPGSEEGLRILKSVKTEYGVPILSDVHCREAVEVADLRYFSKARAVSRHCQARE